MISKAMTQLCPRCQREEFTPLDSYTGPPAPLPPAKSRFDNETEICSTCGSDEAMRQFTGDSLPGPEDWPVNPRWGNELKAVTEQADKDLNGPVDQDG
jgi:hypothetical protein